MKRIILILSSLLMCVATVSAQDIITKKNGEDIQAKVLEIDNNNVKYKLFDEPNGVTYTMPKAQILIIRYESGRNELFNTASTSTYRYETNMEAPVEGIRAGMKYNELKLLYNHKDWYSQIGDKSPALMGVCSWLIPGLGQMICGEVGRGFGWLGASIGCSFVSGLGLGLMYDNEELGVILSGVGSVALLAVDVCAIIDAVRVTKVRNMYEQDLRKINYSFKIHPSIDYIKIGNGVQPTAGLTLAMTF